MAEEQHSRFQLAIRAVALTVIVLILGNTAADVVVGRWPGVGGGFGFIDAPDVLVFHLIFTGLPLFVLATFRVRGRAMWWTATMLTAASWVYAVWQLRQDYLSGFEGGANIGLGLIMMAAPFAILLALMVLSFLLRVTAASKG